MAWSFWREVIKVEEPEVGDDWRSATTGEILEGFITVFSIAQPNKYLWR